VSLWIGEVNELIVKTKNLKQHKHNICLIQNGIILLNLLNIIYKKKILYIKEPHLYSIKRYSYPHMRIVVFAITSACADSGCGWLVSAHIYTHNMNAMLEYIMGFDLSIDCNLLQSVDCIQIWFYSP
jgi:hypothetical protein